MTHILKINEPLVRTVMQAIADDLEAWDQEWYVSDNADGKRRFCFAGRALCIQGYTVGSWHGNLRQFDTYGNRVKNSMEEAAAELGFTYKQAADIFGWCPQTITTDGLRDIPLEEQFVQFAEFVLAQTGIDCR